MSSLKITKECPICGALFNSTIYSEEDLCGKCKAVCTIIPSEDYDSDARSVIDSLISPYGRTSIYRYE